MQRVLVLLTVTLALVALIFTVYLLRPETPALCEYQGRQYSAGIQWAIDSCNQCDCVLSADRTTTEIRCTQKDCNPPKPNPSLSNCSLGTIHMAGKSISLSCDGTTKEIHAIINLPSPAESPGK